MTLPITLPYCNIHNTTNMQQHSLGTAVGTIIFVKPQEDQPINIFTTNIISFYVRFVYVVHLDWFQIVVVVLQLLAVVHRRVVAIAGSTEGTAVVLVRVWVTVVQQRLLRVATLPCPAHHHMVNMAFKGTVQHVITR